MFPFSKKGLANPKDEYTVFYGERVPLWILVTAEGPTGHGSRFIPDTAVSKLIKVANHALEFRATQEKALGWGDGTAASSTSSSTSSSTAAGGAGGAAGDGKEEDEAPGTSSGSHDHAPGCSHCQAKKLGDVTTLNLTMLRAGVSLDEGKTFALNVIPTTAEAGLDVRVTPNTPIPEICAMLDRWCAEEGGLSWKFAPWAGKHLEEHYTTSVDPAKNPWWAAFAGACDRMGMKLVPEIFPAGTDSRFVRQLGLNALG